MNIKYTLLLLPFLSLALSEPSFQKTACQDFKTGKFEIIEKARKLDYTVERNDSIQVEKNNGTGEILVFRIYWINDCQYKLLLIAGEKKMSDFYKNKYLNIEITETFADSYKFSAKLDGDDNVRYYTIKKVKE